MVRRTGLNVWVTVNAYRRYLNPLKGKKKSILKLFIGALKPNYVIIVAVKIVGAKSGISRRQYGRRIFTGNRAVVSLGIRMRRNRSKINGNAIKKSNHIFFETFKKRFYFVKKITDINQSLSLLFRLNGDSVLGHFLKPFKKFNASFIADHVFAINIFGKPRTIIEAYRYTGVNGIILICLITKIAATKYRTFRIIILKKRQINKVLIIILLEIDNFLQRERVANTHIKRKGSNVRFKSSFIADHVFAINIFGKPRTIIEAYRYTGVNGIILICLITKIAATKYQRLNTDYLRLQSLKLLKWLLNAQKGKKKARSFEREKKLFICRVVKHWGGLTGYLKFKLYESVWSAENLKDRPRMPERARKKRKLKKEQFLLAIAPLVKDLRRFNKRNTASGP
ncbi:hypothetical protein GGTG_11546 [Gaeumannomyces tritici R3-111a-1]|uniref:Uncharacterized protein n=1 Tax=Gaeumannomyces tritici (strain R3-111a-1) TaxID=644352 RepID=J3PDH3_GAET3|nr:hypothetical protein GGTG_11546 [Gaeumannomyces tritici R3-111a-1]EJT70523.1 hypothetical protein GGTG_11546 [Gaeumannomyces tritici R3-111a-1]